MKVKCGIVGVHELALDYKIDGLKCYLFWKEYRNEHVFLLFCLNLLILSGDKFQTWASISICFLLHINKKTNLFNSFVPPTMILIKILSSHYKYALNQVLRMEKHYVTFFTPTSASVIEKYFSSLLFISNIQYILLLNCVGTLKTNVLFTSVFKKPQ